VANTFSPDLAGITITDEQVAIDAGQIGANGIRYVGRVRPVTSGSDLKAGQVGGSGSVP
jgi:hypothetical protein